METMRLYHTGYLQIPEPDIHHGRKNADFGQGFYTTPDREFAYTWAREHKGSDTYVNQYELDLSGLSVKRFERTEEWYQYIYRNRSGYPDLYAEADVICGPIANDTIYDLFGIITSGFLSPQNALRLLQAGPCYEQTVIKSSRAAAQLKWTGAEILEPAFIAANRAAVQKAEEAYQKEIAELLESI